VSRAAVVALLAAASCSGEQWAPLPKTSSGKSDRPASRGEVLARGRPVTSSWARVPRFKPRTGEGLRALPDADLAEWAGATWLRDPVAVNGAHRGKEDLDARLALASYGSGVSLAIEVRDDRHHPAAASSAFDTSDHVEVHLWATGQPGIRFRLGSLRQLVEVLEPAEPWRGEKISAAGAAASGLEGGGAGYRVEARVPLMVLTPLPAPRIEELRYRVTVFDTDGDERATPGLRFEGVVRLDPALEVPEAVQKRGSVRICVSSEVGALWAYENGWRCAVPFDDDAPGPDDTVALPGRGLGYARVPSPPRIVWIRERVLFVNFTGVRRGVAALLDGRDTILSVMPLGVVGAEDPGNPRMTDSGAEPVRLPDGTYALAVTHAYPAEPGPLGGRCAAGHRVFLSLVALRGCYRSTPQEPAPEPKHTPYLEEVFRVLLEDCEHSVANDWTMSRDRKTIRVRSSLYPERPPVVWVFRDGRYAPRSPALARDGEGR